MTQAFSTLLFFFQAMSLFPEAQKKAQAELDRVVGRDRLPTFEDRAQLPYVSNVVKETLRWMPVSMLGTHPYFPACHGRYLSLMTQSVIGIPHATSEADTYRGWYIPKGTIVIANL